MNDYRAITTLKVWPDNYNKGDVEAIARSILRYGFNGALCVWRNDELRARNHSLKALLWLEAAGPEKAYHKLLGWAYDPIQHPWPPVNIQVSDSQWLVRCVDISHLNENEAIQFAIADNETARRATRDEELLAQYLAEIAEVEGRMALAATGLADDEIARLLELVRPPEDPPEDPGAEVDRAEELMTKWQTAHGQLWEIPSSTMPGRSHRLLCGDSTDVAAITRLMAGERAVLFSTDPPYLVDYDGTNHPHKWNGPDKNKDWSESYHDWDDASQGEGLYDGFIAVALQAAIVENAAWYCWHASRNQAMLEAVWERHGAFVHQQIIWAKDRPILTRSWYMWQHEPCFFGWVKGQKPRRTAEDYPPSIWEVPTIAPGTSTDHPTSKPVELFAIPMRQHTFPGEICYEPFAGSGSQFVAGEQLGRVVYGVELQPQFVAVILERLTGMGLAPRLVEEDIAVAGQEA